MKWIVNAIAKSRLDRRGKNEWRVRFFKRSTDEEEEAIRAPRGHCEQSKKQEDGQRDIDRSCVTNTHVFLTSYWFSLRLSNYTILFHVTYHNLLTCQSYLPILSTYLTYPY